MLERLALERLSATDCAELAFDAGPQRRVVGAIVELAGPALSAADVRASIADAAARSPVLGRRVRRLPPGCGRPVWEPMAPDLTTHVRAARCGDDRVDLLALAARVVRVPLPRNRPLWRLVVVERPAGPSALIWVSHHAAGDGPVLLAELLEVLGGRSSRGPGFEPAARLTNRSLAREAVVTRLRALTRWRVGTATLRRASAELAWTRGLGASPASFNVPVGADLAYATCTVPLRAVHDGARTCGATVNDALLCATGAALGAELARRGERPGRLVATVAATFAARGEARPRNEVTGMLVPIPTDLRHDVTTRLRTVAAQSRERKAHLSAAVPTVLAPVLRVLAACGLSGWAFERQRLVNVAVSNLRGPSVAPVVCGRTAGSIAPLGTLVGNVPVAVMALSTGDDLLVTLCLSGSLRASSSALVCALSADLRAIAALGGESS